MSIYELRTYTIYVGKMKQATEIYEKYGSIWLKKYKKNLINYFIGDIGAMNQIIHIWKFENEEQRRKLWNKIFSDEDFESFAKKFRPHVLNQQNKLMIKAPWSP